MRTRTVPRLYRGRIVLKLRHLNLQLLVRGQTNIHIYIVLTFVNATVLVQAVN
jgi:hypothetical protein